MSWAKYAKEGLARGETVHIKPRGHSMKGKVNDGDHVTVEPCDASTLARRMRYGLATKFIDILLWFQMSGCHHCVVRKAKPSGYKLTVS